MLVRRYYVDTSAYLAILLCEPGHEEVARELDGQALLSSSLLVLEARRNLVRHARQGAFAPSNLQDALDQLERDLAFFELRDLTLDLCNSNVMPILSTPRSLDLAHLRTALWFHAIDPIERFVTLDTDQRLSARELGLPT